MKWNKQDYRGGGGWRETKFTCTSVIRETFTREWFRSFSYSLQTTDFYNHTHTVRFSQQHQFNCMQRRPRSCCWTLRFFFKFSQRINAIRSQRGTAGKFVIWIIFLMCRPRADNKKRMKNGGQWSDPIDCIEASNPNVHSFPLQRQTESCRDST